MAAVWPSENCGRGRSQTRPYSAARDETPALANHAALRVQSAGAACGMTPYDSFRRIFYT